MNTCSCFLFLLQLLSKFIINYTCYYLTEKGALSWIYPLYQSMNQSMADHLLTQPPINPSITHPLNQLVNLSVSQSINH